MTLALSTFYRTALSKGADMVTVETCIRNIEAYLEIQLIMHDNDFKVELEYRSVCAAGVGSEACPCSPSLRMLWSMAWM